MATFYDQEAAKGTELFRPAGGFRDRSVGGEPWANVILEP
jgi:hypothetical protein